MDQAPATATTPLAEQLIDPTLFRQQAVIDGEWLSGDRSAAVVDPATGREIGRVPELTAADTARAIDAANAALPAWRARPAKERAAILRKWSDLMLANADDLARIMTLEQGKPLAEAKGEITYAASFFEWFGEEAKRMYGDVIPAPAGDRRILTIRQPVGVCALITPWNFPAAMLTRKLGPALAAGCTAVVKPSELTPYSAFALAVLGERAGVPKGVVNIVTGDAKTIGAELTANPIVRKLSFTGSTAVGKLLMEQCAGTVKKLSLELGGNAPFIVFDDADLEAAVAGAIASKYRNAGQTCVCANRMYVQAGIYDRFAERLAEVAGALKLGHGLDAGTKLGPLIDERAVAKVERHVADALARGAKLLIGGKRPEGSGSYFQPTVLVDVPADALSMREEIFGPVAPLVRFETEEEVVRLANATPFGLAAYFYSRDIGRVWRVAEALETGMVGINEGIISNEMSPFGGVKESGLGREGSKYGLEEYTELKYLCMGGL